MYGLSSWIVFPFAVSGVARSGRDGIELKLAGELVVLQGHEKFRDFEHVFDERPRFSEEKRIEGTRDAHQVNANGLKFGFQ